MVLLRRVIGDALRARRRSQHRTLREVSTSANVSLGYLSEIERGQKEASSELLSSICDALGAQLSEVLREVSDTMALAEQMEVLVPVGGQAQESSVGRQPTGERAASTGDTATAHAMARARAAATGPARAPKVTDGKIIDGRVLVAVHRDGPLKTTLRATRAGRQPHDRDAVYA
jgi:transcriptional regulator with XRE-family HTH domain